jgi:hypothetical protein
VHGAVEEVAGTIPFPAAFKAQHILLLERQLFAEAYDGSR